MCSRKNIYLHIHPRGDKGWEHVIACQECNKHTGSIPGGAIGEMTKIIHSHVNRRIPFFYDWHEVRHWNADHCQRMDEETPEWTGPFKTTAQDLADRIPGAVLVTRSGAER